MKKKGFTLIELLAVIAILAIVLLIAIPTILNMIEKARKGSFRDDSLTVIKASKEYLGYAGIGESGYNLTFRGNTAWIDVSKLNISENDIKGSVKIQKDGDTTRYILYIWNGRYRICGKEYPEVKDVEISSEECDIPLPTTMATISGTSATSPFLGGPIERNTIETVSFATSNTVPEGVIGSWDIGAIKNGSIMAWYTTASAGKYNVVIGQDGGVIAPSNSNGLFMNLTQLKSLDLTNLDTSNVETMVFFFYGTSSLTNIDLSPLDTSNVTRMNSMFSGSGLTNLDLSPLNTSNVYDMANMLSEMLNLNTLTIGNLDTSNVTTMEAMFYGNKIANLDLRGLDTSSVTSMRMMFDSTSLTSLNVSGWDTSSVTTFTAMFEQATGPASLNLSSFQMAQATDLSFMFAANSTITCIDLRGTDFGSSASLSQMFQGKNASLVVRAKDSTAQTRLQNAGGSGVTVGGAACPGT